MKNLWSNSVIWDNRQSIEGNKLRPLKNNFQSFWKLFWNYFHYSFPIIDKMWSKKLVNQKFFPGKTWSKWQTLTPNKWKAFRFKKESSISATPNKVCWKRRCYNQSLHFKSFFQTTEIESIFPKKSIFVWKTWQQFFLEQQFWGKLTNCIFLLCHGEINTSKGLDSSTKDWNLN